MTPLGPLGQPAAFPDHPDKSVLFAVARADARARAQLSSKDLPPYGEDVWTAWEFAWRDAKGRPQAAVLQLTFPMTASYIVESKSLKLYLHGYAQARFDAGRDVCKQIGDDLEALVGARPRLELLSLHSDRLQVVVPPERDVDSMWPALGASETDAHVDRTLLGPPVAGDDAVITQRFGSLCPVTGQPDWASIRVQWRGQGPSPERLLLYLEGFRRHQAFHEACTEVIWSDIHSQCQPAALAVMAQFTRRGGIEIAPTRADTPELLAWRRLSRL